METITSKELLSQLTKTVLGKIIFKEYKLTNGIVINTYFNDRYRSKNEAKFNSETVDRLLDVYQIELNLEKDHKIDDIKSNNTLNSLINFFLSIGVTPEIQKFLCMDQTSTETLNKRVIFSILSMTLNKVTNLPTLDVTSLNNELIQQLPQIKECAKKSAISTNDSNEIYSVIQNMAEGGTFSYQNSINPTTFLNKVTKPSSKFIGREDELHSIKQSFLDNGYAILKGIGGIGKTDIAKKYADIHKNEYAEKILITFNTDLRTSLTNIKCADDPLFENETFEQHFNRILSRLLSLGKNLLLIIDNIETLPSDEPFFQELVAHDFDIIFTTRNVWQDSIEIKPLDNDSIKELFTSHCPKYRKSIEEIWLDLDSILKFVEYHTLTIELIAKLLQNSALELQELNSKIRIELNKKDETKINVSKDGTFQYDTMYSHIEALYFINFSSKRIVTEAENILANLALIPEIGMPLSVTLSLLSLPNSNIINTLDAFGWIQIDENQIIHIHAIIRELLLSKNRKNPSIYNILLENIRQVAGTRDETRNYQRDLYMCELFFSVGQRIDRNDSNWCIFLNLSITYLVEFDNLEYALLLLPRLIDMIQKNKDNIDSKIIFLSYTLITRLYIKAKLFSFAEAYYKQTLQICNVNFVGTQFEDIMSQEVTDLYAELQNAEGNTFAALRAYDAILPLDEKNINITMQNIDSYRNYIELLQLNKSNYAICNSVYLSIIEFAESYYGNESIYVANLYASYAYFRCKYKPDEGNINIRHAEYALKILHEKNFLNSSEIAFAFISYSKCKRCQKDYEASRDYLIKALSIYNDLPESDRLVTCHAELAEVYVELNENSTAVSEFTAALDYVISHQNKDYQIFDQHICTLSFQRGITFTRLGKYATAIIDFLKCIKHWEDVPDQTSIFFTIDRVYYHLLESTCNLLIENKSAVQNEEENFSLCENVLSSVDALFYEYDQAHSGFMHFIAESTIDYYMRSESYTNAFEICENIIDYFKQNDIDEPFYYDLILYRSIISQCITPAANPYINVLLDYEKDAENEIFDFKELTALAYAALGSYYKDTDKLKAEQYTEKSLSILNL